MSMTLCHDSTPSASDPVRVLVTGIGLITGLGRTRETTWRRMKLGHSAACVLDLPSGEGSPPFVGFPASPGDHRIAPQLARAVVEAFRDAGLREDGSIDRDRVATVIGLSKGDLGRLAWIQVMCRQGGPNAEPALSTLREAWPDIGAVSVAAAFDFRGPSLAPIAACATGVIAGLQAADLIRRGVCDLAVAGSAESLTPFLLALFRKMGVLAHVRDDPSRAVRPWDRHRSGFLVGEGAAILVLERAEHARARGVLPYAEIAGGAFGSDAHHETALNPDPTGLAHLIRRALADADVKPSEIDYVNVHGTATRSNDPLECRAIRLALGDAADQVSCSANKAQIGHLLGAAGSAELAITCLAIRDGFVPPTLNLTDPDPECDLDGTPLVGKPRPIRTALKLSIGFGGHLAAAVLRRPEGPRRTCNNVNT
jgi:3-oxoacyl-[acyl-carrier-protein] synthase II